MKVAKANFVLGCVLALMIQTSGCRRIESSPGKSESLKKVIARTELVNNLKQFRLAYESFQAVNRSKKGPASWEDLERYYERDPAITNLIASGQFAVIWNVATMPNEASVLAFEASPNSKGLRYVLLTGNDEWVKQVSNAEFEGLPKAVPTK